MSDGATGGAGPGAATGEELAAMRAGYARALPWIAAPWDAYFPALFATLDTLTGALAEAERERAADAAVLAAIEHLDAALAEEQQYGRDRHGAGSVGHMHARAVTNEAIDGVLAALVARRAATTTGEASAGGPVTDADLHAFGLTMNDRFDQLVLQLYQRGQHLLRGTKCRACGAELVVLSADWGFLDRRIVQFMAEHRHDGAVPGEEDADGADAGR